MSGDEEVNKKKQQMNNATKQGEGAGGALHT